MWFKNKLTGLKWEVEGEVAERLSLSPDYEPVEEEKAEPKKKKKE